MLEVNLVAPFVISRAFAEHVARSERKVIAFITSRMGSIGLNNTGRSYAYRSRSPQICVLGLHPGKVAMQGDEG